VVSSTLLSAGGGDATCWVGAFPTHVGCWAINRGHRSVQQPAINSKLGAMMCRVQDSPPEDPNSLSLNVKEWHDGQPPLLVLLRQTHQTFAREFNRPLGIARSSSDF